MSAIKDHPNAAHKQEVIIRKAQKKDAAAICLLLYELAEGEGRRCLQSEATVAQDLLGEASLMRLLVAEVAGVVVGLLCYYPGYDVESASWGNHLADIIVTKAYQGRGIGTLLMQELARLTLAAEGEWVSWTVLKANRDATRFYERLGGQKVALHFMAMGSRGLAALVEN